MAINENIKQRLVALKSMIEREAITPLYLGSMLEEIIAQLESAIQKAEAKATNLKFPITIADTDIADLIVQDENGYPMLQVKAGHIKTPRFDSSKIWEMINKAEHPLKIKDTNKADLIIADEYERPMLQIKGGHIKTDKFDSAKVPMKSFDHPITTKYTEIAELIIADEDENPIVTIKDGHIITDKFNSAEIGTLKGKSFAVLGDSMSTYSGQTGCNNTWYPRADVDSPAKLWYRKLEKLTQMKLSRVAATGGATVAAKEGSEQFRNIASKLFSNGSVGDAPEIILILAGMNDWINSLPLGQFSDQASQQSFIPAYKALLEQVKRTYPKSKIFVLTPIPAYCCELSQTTPPVKTDGAAQADYVAAIRACAAQADIDVIDLWQSLEINYTASETYFIDGVHPHDITHTMMAKQIQQSLKKLI